MKKIRKNRGITLVALVITIIIIIILATVTINMAFGDNGLIKQAELARDMAANSTTAEGEDMNRLMQEYSNIMAEDSEIPPSDTRSELAKARDDGTRFDKTTDLEDDSGDIIWVPGGFKVTEDSSSEIDEGAVIQDDKGNQFVWIPVNNTSLNEMYQSASGTKLTGVTTTTNVYSKLRFINRETTNIGGRPGNGTDREPDLIIGNVFDESTSIYYDANASYYQDILGYASRQAMADAMVAEYTATYNSIQKYKGFYIGRYELTGSVSSPTVQKGQTVLTGQNWYNLKKACTNVVNGDKYGAQSTMIYGNQWDEVMVWLIDTEAKSGEDVYDEPSSWGNYLDSTGAAATNSGTERPSGYNEAWQANNIYDLAGNCWEWTQEAYSYDCRVKRGR